MSGYPSVVAFAGASVDVPEGVAVYHPRTAKHCYGVVTQMQGSGKLTRPLQCRGRARPGKLTCSAHRRLDDQAQAFKSEVADARV